MICHYDLWLRSVSILFLGSHVIWVVINSKHWYASLGLPSPNKNAYLLWTITCSKILSVHWVDANSCSIPGPPSLLGSIKQDLCTCHSQLMWVSEGGVGRAGRRQQGVYGIGEGKRRTVLGQYAGGRFGTQRYARSKPGLWAVWHSLWLFPSAWLCATSRGNTEPNRPIGDCCSTTRVRGKNSACPAVARYQPQPRTGCTAGMSLSCECLEQKA